jgi:formylglycine-generating enzyme required for sulfatase activity
MNLKLFPLWSVVVLGAFSISGSAQAQSPEPVMPLNLGSGVSLETVLVKAATFRQGSPSAEAGRGDDEDERDVTISQDFYIGKYEVTVGEFRRFVDETGYKTEAEKGTSGGFGWNGQALEQRPQFNWRNPGFAQTDRHPVTIVTFDDAIAFTRWLSRKSGRIVTLPTEAQWELAARGGLATAFPSTGKGARVSDLGWSKANAPDGTRPVGTKDPNAIGLFDMAGNVAEWCLDWYGTYPLGAITDPVDTRSGQGDKPRRVLRGGSWLRDAKNGRSAARHRNTPGTRNADNGFRVVVSTTTAPLPAAATTDTSASGSPEAEDAGSPQWVAIAKLVGALVALRLGFVALGRLFGKKSGSARGADGVKTNIEDDGFRIRTAPLKSGSKVHYRYVVDGQERTGSVTSPDAAGIAQMIYTGARPSSVEILGVTRPGESLAAARSVPAQSAYDDRTTTRSDDSYSSNYPSAY